MAVRTKLAMCARLACVPTFHNVGAVGAPSRRPESTIGVSRLDIETREGAANTSAGVQLGLVKHWRATACLRSGNMTSHDAGNRDSQLRKARCDLISLAEAQEATAMQCTRLGVIACLLL
jgi:hypothetical protein